MRGKPRLSFDEILLKGLIKTSDFGVTNTTELKLLFDDITRKDTYV